MTYEETVASDVAARYGCPVSPSSVHILPPATVLISGGLEAIARDFGHRPADGRSVKPGGFARGGKKNHDRSVAWMKEIEPKLREAVAKAGSCSGAARLLDMPISTIVVYCRRLGIVSPKAAGMGGKQ